MSKKSLKECQMSDAVYVERAVTWSKELTRMRTPAPGYLDRAMRDIERDYGVDYWTLWQLRYRADRIKTLSVSIYLRLEAAYHAERARQRRLYDDEREETPKGGIAAALVGAADALAGSEDGTD